MLIEKDQKNLKQLLQSYNFNHLKPEKLAYDIVIPSIEKIIMIEDEHFFQSKEGVKKRKIFYGVPYTTKEEERIKIIQEKLAFENIYQNFPNQIILKHLYAVDFNEQKVIERLKKLQEFHNNPIITIFTSTTLLGLKRGCIYTHGYDKYFRPIIVIQAGQFDYSLSIEQNFNIVYFVMIVVIGYRMIPYHAQKYITIFDLNNLPLSDIPVKYLLEIVNLMSIYYCSNLERTFVYNWKGIGWAWNVLSKLIPEQIKHKIQFIEKEKQSEILQHVNENQLQIKYGGKVENIQEYWPKKQQYEVGGINLILQENEEVETDFLSIKNDSNFFLEKPELFCGSNPCKNCSIF